MIRAPFCDQAYWDKWIDFELKDIAKMLAQVAEPSGNPSYRPQYVFEIAKEYWHLIFYRYSRGDDIHELKQYFLPMLQAWEESNRLHLEFRSKEELEDRRNWTINLDHYIVSFWLVGLALVFEIPDNQWQRLVALIGNEGNDILLDRIIATRQLGRKIGDKLCHPNPYQRLLDTTSAPVEQQAKLLASFVENWYVELNRLPKNKSLSEDTMIYERPYWYKYGEKNIAGGAYFGQWCVEAIAVVKAFGIDDSLCVGHPHYPGDLLRPGQVTPPDMTRLPKPLKEWLRNQVTVPENLYASSTKNDAALSKLGWWQRFFNRR